MNAVQAKWSAVLELTREALIEVTPEGKIRGWSPGAEQLLDYSKSEILGQPLSTLFGEDDGQFQMQLHDSLLTGIQINRQSATLRSRSGSEIAISLTSIPIYDESSQLTEMILFLRQYEPEVAREVNHVPMGQTALDIASHVILENISHEFLTPLNSTLGMLELALQDPQLAVQTREYLVTANDSAHKLQDLINDLLDFARLSEGDLLLQDRVFDLRELVDRTVSGLSERASEQGVELTSRIDGNLAPRYRGDARRIRQVLTILIGNSIKFTRAGSITVWVRERERAMDLVRLEFVVTDTGIGMATSNLSRLFDPFTQSDQSSTRPYSGIGLGLALVRKIVSLMNGTIEVDSRPHQGTALRIDLALHAADGDETQEVSDRSRADLASRRVLLLHGNQEIQRDLSERLTAWGLDVTCFCSGRSTIRELSTNSESDPGYDLAIIDASIPDFKSTALLKQLRLFPGWDLTPIVLISSPENQVSEELFEELGLIDCPEEKISTPEFEDIIRDSLRNSFVSTPARNPGVQRAPIKRKILVAEDTIANQKVIRSILEQRGYFVQMTSNGSEAVWECRRDPPDAIIMDMQMPFMDGLQATRTIRRTPGIAEVPIIALTAHGNKEHREISFKSGINAYLEKPTDVEELISTIEKLTNDRGNPQIPSTYRTASPPAGMQSSRITMRNIMGSINRNRALARLGGDEDLLKELATMYLEDIPLLLKHLHESLESSEFSEAARHAHSIAGLSSNFDADKCVALARQIESECPNGDQPALTNLAGTLQREIDHLNEELKALLKN